MAAGTGHAAGRRGGGAMTSPPRATILRWTLGVAVWAAVLAGSFFLDEWGYRVVAAGVAEATGYRAERFGIADADGGGALLQMLALLKEMGQFWFILVISGTMIVLRRDRVRQVIVLWACIALAAILGQGLLRPGVAKLRPDARLRPDEIAVLLDRWGEDPAVTGQFRFENRVAVARPPVRNVGKPLFRMPFTGMSGLTFPSGHAALAFAAFAALSAFFARGRWWFLSLAVLVGLSRVLMGEHFLSDVIAGAGVGYASAAVLLAIGPVRGFAGCGSAPQGVAAIDAGSPNPRSGARSRDAAAAGGGITARPESR